MPKLVDTSARQALVFPVVCRIVATEGLHAATVRRVAEEAGLSAQAVRGTWPTQERLHLRVAQWLAGRWREESWTWRTDDVNQYVKKVVRSMVPLDSDSRTRARAWSAYASAAGEDTRLAEVVRQHNRERVMLIERLLDSLRPASPELPAPSRIVLPGDIVPASPDTLEPSSLRVLALVRGLTDLVCDQTLPLSPDRAAAWLDSWEPQLDCGT